MGKILRDSLLVLVILAMGLPFVVAALGSSPLTAEQRDLARTARRAAYAQQDWLSNSMTHKVVLATPLPSGGLRVRERYYTFWGLPWGWSEADVSAAGEVSALRTGLSLTGD
jgi:type II secretory pathway pseudopilin PulG